MAHPLGNNRKATIALPALLCALAIGGGWQQTTNVHPLPTASLDASPLNPYAAAVLADHPVGYWQFDDAARSKVAASSAGHIAGTYFHTGRVEGAIGDARSFNGANSYVSIPSSPAWSQPTTGQLTVEFWMKPAVLTFPHEEGSGYVWILGKGHPGAQEWGFRMYGQNNTENPPRGNRIAFYAYNPAGGEGAGAYFQDSIVPGRWIYVVGELTSNGVRIYKNGTFRQGPPSMGTLYGNPAFNITPATGNAPLNVGTRNLHSYFEGDIDDLAIYPYLLSSAQIRHHFVVARQGNPALGP